MRHINNIYLVGPMGVGKTTIGKHLAKKLRKGFMDSDREIEKRTGVTISTIFDIEGEAGFRKRETNMLAELAAHDDIVLATGGGVVLSERNRQLLSAHGYIIYLKGDADNLWQRAARHKHRRPLLNTDEPKKRLQALLRTRAPLYKQLADMIVSTDDRPIHKVINEISNKLHSL